MKKNLFIIIILALCPLTSLAQSSEAIAHIKEVKDSINVWYKAAEKFYNKNVKPLEEKTNKSQNAAEKQVDQNQIADLQALVQNYDDSIQANNMTITELEESLKAYSGEEFEKSICVYTAHLRNRPCNPKAIESIKGAKKYLTDDLYKESFNNSIKALEKYKKYCEELIKPLKKIELDIQTNGGKQFEENSKPLQRFKNDWDNISYIKDFQQLKDAEQNITYLDDLVEQVEYLKKNGFDNGSDSENDNALAQVQDIMKHLSIDDAVIESPIDEMNSIKAQISSLESKNKELKKSQDRTLKQLNDLNEELAETNDAVRNFEDIDKQRYDMTEEWFDMRQKIDDELLELCKYCLSQPCDPTGENFNNLVNLVLPVFDKAKFPAYIERLDNYKKLFANYKTYTEEIHNFLKSHFGYTNMNGKTIPTKQQNALRSDFDNLSYVKNHYNQRSNKKGIYSPHLNGILENFERMWKRNFSNSADEYKNMYYNELWDNENKSENLKEDAEQLLKGSGIKDNKDLVPESKPKKNKDKTEVPEPNYNNKVPGNNKLPNSKFNFNNMGNGKQVIQEPEVAPATITIVDDDDLITTPENPNNGGAHHGSPDND